MKRNKTRTCRLQILMSPEEYTSLREKFRSTTHRVFSEYVRDVLNQKPIIVRYRNKSLDEFLPVALGFKNELGTICKNINQTIIKLNSGPASAELKDLLDYLAAGQLLVHQKTEEIKNLLIQLFEQW